VAGANRFEDLLSWQRMHELNIEVWKATEHGPVARDFDFRNEIRDAADSAERNIAEGFGRFNPPVFANFLDFSRASALETKSLLKKGLAVGYFKADDAVRLDRLANRGIQAVAKFQRYLRSPEAKRNAARRYRRKWAPKSENAPNEPND
jgi:four helix bundle protein